MNTLQLLIVTICSYEKIKIKVSPSLDEHSRLDGKSRTDRMLNTFDTSISHAGEKVNKLKGYTIDVLWL